MSAPELKRIINGARDNIYGNSDIHVGRIGVTELEDTEERGELLLKHQTD